MTAPTAWSHRTEEGKRNSVRVVMQMSRLKVPCVQCGRVISSNAMGIHLRKCNWGQVEQSKPKRNEHGHTTCACGRKMRIDAPCCFRCAGGEADLIESMGAERARRAGCETIFESHQKMLDYIRKRI
jgi:hypothetical protein